MQVYSIIPLEVSYFIGCVSVFFFTMLLIKQFIQVSDNGISGLNTATPELPVEQPTSAGFNQYYTPIKMYIIIDLFV